MNEVLFLALGSVLTVSAQASFRAFKKFKKGIYEKGYSAGYGEALVKAKEVIPTSTTKMGELLKATNPTPKELIIEHHNVSTGVVARGKNF